MGNRLGGGVRSPKRRTAASRKSTGAAPVDLAAPSQVSVAAHIYDGVDGGAISPIAAAEQATTDSTASHWPQVMATLHAAEAFGTPVNEATTRQRQRHDQQVREHGDPSLFFSRHAVNTGTGDSDDVALVYAHALLEAASGNDMATAAALFRSIAARPVTQTLAAEARVHLAQCLLLVDPTLQTHAAEVEALLTESLRGDVENEMGRQATELLMHVRVARGDFRGAQELLCSAESMVDSVEVAFQRGFCQHILSDDPQSHDLLIEEPDDAVRLQSLHAALLTTDAEALVVGQQASIMISDP